MGKGEEKTAAEIENPIWQNNIEAIIAAIYLDGGIEPAKVFVGKFVLSGVKAQDALRAESSDYKTSLQELIQKPRTNILNTSSSRKADRSSENICCGGVFQGKELGRGRGKSKKEAEQEAAKQAIERQIFERKERYNPCICTS